MSNSLFPLNLEQPELKLAKKGSDIMVWDDIRKKYLKLSPEEWVRQHLVHFLNKNVGVPKSAFALEGGFRLNKKLQRTDILIFKNSKPSLLVECKAPQVKITQAAFDQAARYNLEYKVEHLVISNGLQTYWIKVDFENKKYIHLEKFPKFSEL